MNLCYCFFASIAACAAASLAIRLRPFRTLADRLQAAGVAATPVLKVADLLDDPHYRARHTFIEVRHPLGFDETIYGSYVKMSRTPAVVKPGPVMGQDNDHAFREILQMPDEDYQSLKESRVIY